MRDTSIPPWMTTTSNPQMRSNSTASFVFTRASTLTVCRFDLVTDKVFRRHSHASSKFLRLISFRSPSPSDAPADTKHTYQSTSKNSQGCLDLVEGGTRGVRGKYYIKEGLKTWVLTLPSLRKKWAGLGVLGPASEASFWGGGFQDASRPGARGDWTGVCVCLS